jgi:hypothetical protein
MMAQAATPHQILTIGEAASAADLPHKGPSFTVVSASLIGFTRRSKAGQMYLLLILFWCSVVVRRCLNILRVNSRFGKFNSRLGRREFPVSAATGICRQWLDFPRGFSGQRTVPARESMKFPFQREKPGILSAPAGTARGR